MTTTASVLWLVVTFVLGSMVGSFLNVFIYRVPVGKSLLWPPSHCPGCFTPVGIYNLPIVGYFLVRGRCRHCGMKLSLQYPAVEFMTAALASFAFWRMVLDQGKPLPLFFIYVLVMFALTAATFIDLRWRIIPDRITYLLIVAGPILSAIYPRLMQSGLADFERWSGTSVMGAAFAWLADHPPVGALTGSFLGVVGGAVVVAIVRTLGTLVFRREAMGLGDVKLLAGVGGLLGWKAVPVVFLVAVLVGAVLGIVVYLRTRRHDIPFGPYLALGTAVVMLYGNDIWRWYAGLLSLRAADLLR